MKHSTVFAAFVAGILALGGVSGCHTQAAANAKDNSSELTIMVGGLDKIIYLPAQLTQELGYFKDAGINVKLMTQPSGANAENALIANQVQGVVGFYDHSIVLQTQGKCIESVVQFANVPGEVEVTKADANITDPAQLKGQNLGITSPGSSTDYLTQYFMQNAGVDAADYNRVTAGAGQTFIAALGQSGNAGIVAGMTTDPTVTNLVKSGQGKILFDMRTKEGSTAALGGLYPASSFYMSCDYVRNNPEKVQKLATAFVKTMKFIATSSPDEIAAKMPADYKGANPADYVEALKSSLPMFTADGKMDAAGAENVLKVLRFSNPDVKAAKAPIDLAKTYTSTFVDKANAGS